MSMCVAWQTQQQEAGLQAVSVTLCIYIYICTCVYVCVRVYVYRRIYTHVHGSSPSSGQQWKDLDGDRDLRGRGRKRGREGEIGREREREEREPTAAAIAYGLDKKGSGERNVLLVDGGFVHGETWSTRKRISSEGWAYGVITLMFVRSSSYLNGACWMVDS
jgi:hypothetical protein